MLVGGWNVMAIASCSAVDAGGVAGKMLPTLAFQHTLSLPVVVGESRASVSLRAAVRTGVGTYYPIMQNWGSYLPAHDRTGGFPG